MGVSRAKPLVGHLGAKSPEADDIFVKICYLSRFSLPTSVQYEMEQKSIWRQKSGTARNSACPFGTKMGGQSPALPALPSTFRRQWTILYPEVQDTGHRSSIMRISGKFSLGDFDTSVTGVPVDINPCNPMRDNLVDTSPVKTVKEVTDAVKSATAGKAADSDRITSELLRASGAAMIVCYDRVE